MYMRKLRILLEKRLSSCNLIREGPLVNFFIFLFSRMKRLKWSFKQYYLIADLTYVITLRVKRSLWKLFFFSTFDIRVIFLRTILFYFLFLFFCFCFQIILIVSVQIRCYFKMYNLRCIFFKLFFKCASCVKCSIGKYL